MNTLVPSLDSCRPCGEVVCATIEMLVEFVAVVISQAVASTYSYITLLLPTRYSLLPSFYTTLAVVIVEPLYDQ